MNLFNSELLLIYSLQVADRQQIYITTYLLVVTITHAKHVCIGNFSKRTPLVMCIHQLYCNSIKAISTAEDSLFTISNHFLLHIIITVAWLATDSECICNETTKVGILSKNFSRIRKYLYKKIRGQDLSQWILATKTWVCQCNLSNSMKFLRITKLNLVRLCICTRFINSLAFHFTNLYTYAYE